MARAGTFRQVVEIQEKIVTPDSYGQESITWATIADVRAAVSPLTGREFIEGGQQQANITTRIRFRYSRSLVVKPDMRAVWQDGPGRSTNYDIVQVLQPNSDMRRVTLLCREAVV